MSRSADTDVPIGTAAGVGAAAYIAGVVLTYGLGILGINRGLELLIGLLGFTGAILSYIGFHTWMLGGGMGGMGSLAVFTALPILLLVGSGYYVASRGRLADTADGFKRGASVAIGYLAVTILALVYFAVVASGNGGSAGGSTGSVVDLVLPVVVTGVVYPVVFGGLGGVLADAT